VSKYRPMARSTIFVFAIAAPLALSGCRTPQHVQDSEQKAAAPHDVPAPVTETAATMRPAPATQPAPPASVPQSSNPSTTVPSATVPATRQAEKPNGPNATAAPKQAASPPVASSKTQPLPVPKPSSLDLNSLEQRLKDTRAIGVFTKLSLKNQVDDLLSEFRAFHKNATKTSPSELRQKYDLLIIKVLSLLQNGDPQLASAIAASREAIWGILMDPQKFANI
jgi:hypothetical protein